MRKRGEKGVQKGCKKGSQQGVLWARQRQVFVSNPRGSTQIFLREVVPDAHLGRPRMWPRCHHEQQGRLCHRKRCCYRAPQEPTKRPDGTPFCTSFAPPFHTFFACSKPLKTAVFRPFFWKTKALPRSTVLGGMPGDHGSTTTGGTVATTTMVMVGVLSLRIWGG